MFNSVELFAATFVTVLVVMDPVGNVPIFLALTSNHSEAQRRRAALVGTSVATGVIVFFAVAGRSLLTGLGISLESLQVAGGLLLLLIALELLRGGGSELEASADPNVALVPLGTPLLAGPGAIATTMLYMGEANDVAQSFVVVGALLTVLLVVYVALRFSTVIARIVKDAGINLLSKVVGLLAAAIAVQLIAEAIEVWVSDGVAM